MSNTLIITLGIEPCYQEHFNSLREKYFPAHANYLDAHITLFHHLPADQPAIRESLSLFVRRKPITLQVTGVSCFGKGVAFTLYAAALLALHKEMQAAFEPWLIRQDRQALRPHITVQNKVTALKAQQLYEKLKEGFSPFSFSTTGLHTWKYLKGPWKAQEMFPFIDG